MYKKQKQDKSQETILGIWCITIPQNSDIHSWKKLGLRISQLRCMFGDSHKAPPTKNRKWLEHFLDSICSKIFRQKKNKKKHLIWRSQKPHSQSISIKPWVNRD